MKYLLFAKIKGFDTQYVPVEFDKGRFIFTKGTELQLKTKEEWENLKKIERRELQQSEIRLQFKYFSVK